MYIRFADLYLDHAAYSTAAFLGLIAAPGLVAAVASTPKTEKYTALLAAAGPLGMCESLPVLYTCNTWVLYWIGLYWVYLSDAL